MYIMKPFLFLLLTCVCLVFTTCSKRPKGSPGENEIWLEYKLFTPAQLVVKAGTTVTFTNKDNANHSVTNANSIFDSGKISSNDSYHFTFSDKGNFSFYCKYHSSVTAEQGVIIVE